MYIYPYSRGTIFFCNFSILKGFRCQQQKLILLPPPPPPPMVLGNYICPYARNNLKDSEAAGSLIPCVAHTCRLVLQACLSMYSIYNLHCTSFQGFIQNFKLGGGGIAVSLTCSYEGILSFHPL